MYLLKKNNLQVYSKSLFLIPGSADGSGVLHQSAEGRKASGRDLLTVRAPCLPAFQEPATELLQDLDHLPPSSTEPYKRHLEPQLGRTWDGMAPLRDITCLQPGLASSATGRLLLLPPWEGKAYGPHSKWETSSWGTHVSVALQLERI